MHSTSDFGKARKRPLVRRLVIVAILLFIVIEPVVMYHSLMREREQRLQALLHTSTTATAHRTDSAQ